MFELGYAMVKLLAIFLNIQSLVQFT